MAAPRWLQRLGRAVLWAIVTGALSAAIGSAIAAAVCAALNRDSTDVIDGVIGMGIVLGGLVGFIAAFIFRNAHPGQRVAGFVQRLGPSPDSDWAVKRRAKIREHPVQSAITIGGTWGLAMWGVSAATDRSARTPTDLLLALAFGLLFFGPLITWVALRRDR